MVVARLRGQKTYWHLLSAQRMPTRYELLSSRLRYYPQSDAAVKTPVSEFNSRQQRGSALQAADWEGYADPRATTYASYVGLQREQEAYIDGLLSHAKKPDQPPEWAAFVGNNLGVLRYPCHALMMLAAYLGQASPGGRITISAAFQMGDELRRVQRLAYRLRMLQYHSPGLGDDARARWEGAEAWQPLRRLVERLLVAYDWGECFVALNLVAKPVFDWLLELDFAAEAQERGDRLTSELLGGLAGDTAWHRAWSRELVRAALSARDENRAAIQGWVDSWSPAAIQAASSLAGELAGANLDDTRERLAAYLGECGLEAPR